MEALSSRYGWTPSEIRDMSLEDVYQYLEIISEINLLKRRNERLK
jgi:hypothetical protein